MTLRMMMKRMIYNVAEDEVQEDDVAEDEVEADEVEEDDFVKGGR